MKLYAVAECVGKENKKSENKSELPHHHDSFLELESVNECQNIWGREKFSSLFTLYI